MNTTMRFQALRGASGIGNDLAMALLVVAIVSLMVLPLPSSAIDALLALNISISVLLLMTTLFIPNAVALSSFPALLLFTTLFRLSLNIASTKAILLHADAGHVISAFGELVVGGNLVVGIVMFLIITVVQFIVIAKGAERVAEVGARFTLDAMPGQQMSIDADLRAGHVTADEAIRRRALLAVESQLHGGMDGAMKFVKGDAIAGLVITLVNLCAGMVVGVMYHGMSTGDSANLFAILSIGDAMVSQIPSLFICVAAGVLITRVADHREKRPRSLGQEIFAQVTHHVRAMYLAAALILAFAAVPGFPVLPFVVLGGALGAAAAAIQKRQAAGQAGVRSKPLVSTMRDGQKGDAPSILPGPPAFAKPLAARLSADVAAQLDETRLDACMTAERDRVRAALGVPFPGLALWVDGTLSGGRFDVLLNDCVVLEARCTLVAGDVERQLVSEVGRMLRQHAHLFVGIQEVQWVLESATPDYPQLVAEVQKVLPVARLADVLRRLLEEQVPIRNLRSIFESLIAWAPKEKDVVMLTEYVRIDLGRYLAQRAAGGREPLAAILLDPDVEQAVRQCIKPTPAGNYLAMAPEAMAEFADKVGRACGDAPPEVMAIVTSMDIRRYVRKIIEGRLPALKVLSYQELAQHVELRTAGRVEP